MTMGSWAPPNCSFYIQDVEEAWNTRDHFDFIICRDPVGSIRDFPKLFRQIWQHLEPGGIVELQCIIPIPACDDNSLRSVSKLREFYEEKVSTAYRQYGTSLQSPYEFADILRREGFINVKEEDKKIPIGIWHEDPLLKEVGSDQAMLLLEDAAGPFFRVFHYAFGWTAERTELELAVVGYREAIMDKNHHEYFPL